MVHVGLNDPADKHITVNAFMPAEISVHVGTSVTWTWDGTLEPHSVSFYPGDGRPAPGPPDPKTFAPIPATGPLDGTSAASSGLQPAGPEPAKPFKASFAKTGTYKYYCVIHPQMLGTVNVTEASDKQDTATEVASKGKDEQERYLAEGQGAAKELAATAPEKNSTSDGATTYTIVMGKSTRHTDVMAFSPSPANIKAGDKVMFVNSSSAPHTATFYNGKPPFHGPDDPAARTPSPGTSPQTLNTTDLFNTATLPPDAPPGHGPPLPARSYIYKVPAAGNYAYICVFHSNEGMTGTIAAS
ncbi:MAG: hypothetical protein NVS3B12_15650 [Acidimicrobiales bacterium]